MNIRATFLRMMVLLFIITGASAKSFGLPDRDIQISPIQIVWDDDLRSFHAFFDVSNHLTTEQDLTAIIVFKVNGFKRWRGTRLPPIKGGARESFKLTFTPGIMLKNEYVAITVNIYGKDYEGLLDYSSRYLQIESRRRIEDGRTQIELTETLPAEDPEDTIRRKKLFSLGTEAQLPQLLATEKFQNVDLTPLTPAEKTAWLERIAEPDPVPRPAPEPPNLSGKPGIGQIALFWEPVADAERYHLYWSRHKNVDRVSAERIAAVDSGFIHRDIEPETPYYYRLAAEAEGQESELSNEIALIAAAPIVRPDPPKPPPVVETPVSELLESVQVSAITAITTDPALLVNISDRQAAQAEALKRAQELEALDIRSRDQLIALYIAEGKSESVAQALSGQLEKEPENLNLSLSLSKVYHEQGDTQAALRVLNSSLNRISLSARIALNQELRTAVRRGETTLTDMSEEAFLADEFSKLGLSLLERQKYEDALSAFQSLYSLSQDYPLIKYYLGLTRQGLRQYNQAKELFVEQSRQEIAKHELLDDLGALTEVLETSLDIGTIEFARSQYLKLQGQDNTAEEQKEITARIAMLDGLLADAEKRRLDGLPDLGIQLAHRVDYPEVQPGQPIDFSFIVTNHGRKESQEFRVYYQWRHEQGIVYEIAAYDRFQPVPPDLASFAWSKTVTVPEEAIPGNYQLIAHIEQVEGIGEVTLDNNRLVSEATIGVIPPIADLEIQLAEQIEDTIITAGSEIETAWQVTNLGYADSPAYSVIYQLQHQDGTEIRLDPTDTFDPLPKGDVKREWVRKLTMPETLREGQYGIQAVIQPADETLERDKENNTAVTGFHLAFIPPFTDLTVAFSDELTPQAKKGGESIEGAFSLSNQGNTDSGPVTVEYRLVDSDGRVIPLSVTEDIPSLKPDGVRYSWQRELPIPAALAAGRYRLEVELKPERPELEKTLENNRVISAAVIDIIHVFSDLTLAFAPKPDPQDISAGGRLEFGLSVHNLGNTTSSKAQIEFFLIDEQNQPLRLDTETPLASLEAGRSVELQPQLRLPDDLAPGYYQLAARLVLEDPAIERNLDNNRVESERELLYLRPYTDLTLGFTTAMTARTLSPDETIETALTLSNRGNITARDIEVVYRLEHEDGTHYDIPVSDRIDRIDPEKPPVVLDKALELPETLQTGKYRIVASIKTAPPIDIVPESHIARSDWVLAYTAPAPPVTIEPPVPIEVVEEKPSNLLRHVAAVSLAIGAGWQAREENTKYEAAKDRQAELKQQYNSSTTATQVAIINAELESNQSQAKLYARNANFWEAVALVGVGWEIYNIFFWSPPGSGLTAATDTSIEKPTRVWMHAAAIGVALGGFWQSQQEMTRYQELSDENDRLRRDYQTSSSETDVAGIKNRIAGNREQMASHVANANIFDGITIAALGVEGYLLWKTWKTPADTGTRRINPSAPDLSFKPVWANRKLGIALEWSW